MRINIEADHLLSHFLGEHYQDPSNLEINLKKCTHLEVPHLFYSRKCKGCCAVLATLLYICCDKVRLWLFFSLQQLQLLLDISLCWLELHSENLFSVDMCACACTVGKKHLNEEVFELVIAIKIQGRKIELCGTLLRNDYGVRREGHKPQ